MNLRLAANALCSHLTDKFSLSIAVHAEFAAGLADLRLTKLRRFSSLTWHFSGLNRR
jgi:hypothetical protein